jgi:hypothetical protein
MLMAGLKSTRPGQKDSRQSLSMGRLIGEHQIVTMNQKFAFTVA